VTLVTDEINDRRAGVPDKLLHIYLNDHLAGAVVARELAKRCLSNNRATPLGTWLEGFMVEAADDRRVLESIIAAVGGKRSRVKPIFGWIAEKAGRFKLNGRAVGYSDLSRLEEIEGLCVLVDAKKTRWMALREAQNHDDRLSRFDFEAAIETARQQRHALEGFRIDAAMKVTI
jgi:hypothetical protein